MTHYKIMCVKHVAKHFAHVNSINVSNNGGSAAMVCVRGNQQENNFELSARTQPMSAVIREDLNQEMGLELGPT